MGKCKSKTVKPLADLHPELVKNTKRGSNLSPLILTKAVGHADYDVVVFAGCDFEVVMLNNVAVAYRYKNNVYIAYEAASDLASRFYVGSCFEISGASVEYVPRIKFNKSLIDCMVLALKKVTTGPEVVAASAHFTDIIVKTLEELDKLTSKAWQKADNLIDEIDNVKERLFSRLMSKDMRR